jgi:O-antigen/teichoic acid export membrane protein
MKSLTSNLKQKFIVQFGSDFFNKILTMIAGIFVARLAGPEVVGTIAYATSYVMVFAIFTGIFGPGHIKLLSEVKEGGDCIATYTRLQMICYATWFLTVLGWFVVQKYFLAIPFESQTQETVILIMLTAILFTFLVDINNPSFTARLEQAKANYPLIVNNVLYNFGRIIIVVLGLKAIALVSWNLVTSVLLLPLAYRLFKTLPWGRWDRKLAWKYLTYGLPFVFLNASDILTKYSDKLILHRYASTKELGYYTAAMSIGGLILLSGRSIAVVFFPLFSHLIASNNWEAVNKKIENFEGFTTTFLLPAVCLLAIISEPLIILLLGPRYQPSANPLKLLLFSSYLTLVGMPYGNIVAGMGRFYIAVWINIVKLIVYAVALFLFISPQYLGLGATGLAWNMLVVNLVNNVLFFIVSKRIGNIQIGSHNAFRNIVILAVSSVFYWTNPYFVHFGSMGWMVIIPLYLITLYGILLISGLCKREQFDELLDLLRIRKTMAYITDEVRRPKT